ncbi:MAG: helix-turn-helix domain-containing protein [Desulfovibrio sp.]|jgi:transcriptional regulator with XRE-family HTH domain|nr:helix-turn-helix domain-containing protein [Desulfovibrio sp.]
MSTVGERIKLLRGGLSQKQLAEQLSIPQTTLSNYETNRSELNLATIAAIITNFGVTSDWLLFGTGPMQSPRTASNSKPKSDNFLPVTKNDFEEYGEKRQHLKDLKEVLQQTEEQLNRTNELGVMAQNEDLMRQVLAISVLLHNRENDLHKAESRLSEIKDKLIEVQDEISRLKDELLAVYKKNPHHSEKGDGTTVAPASAPSAPLPSLTSDE